MLSELEKNNNFIISNNEIKEFINDVMKLKETKPEAFKNVFHLTKKLSETKK